MRLLFVGVPLTNGGAPSRYQIDPEVTLGVAWTPSRWLALAVDLDLLPSGSFFRGNELGIPEVQRQFARVGVEIPLWALDLRAGAHRNIASGEQPNVYSLGLGVDAHTSFILIFHSPQALKTRQSMMATKYQKYCGLASVLVSDSNASTAPERISCSSAVSSVVWS